MSGSVYRRVCGSLAVCTAASLAVCSSASADDAPASATAAAEAPSPRKQARKLIRRLASEADKAGLKLARKARAEEPGTYRVVLQASPHQLAFYADVADGYAPVAGAPSWKYGSADVAFPDAYVVRFPFQRGQPAKQVKTPKAYFERLGKLGEHAAKLPKHLSRRAEVALYTLDGDGNGRVDDADRKATPASGTADPDDVTLLRVVFGTEAEDAGPKSTRTETAALSGVRQWLPGDEASSARPLFTYRLSELFAGFDLNGDGDIDDELIFGDSNGDRKLDAAELAALARTAEKAESDLADNLGADTRLAAAEGREALLDRVRKAHKLSAADAKWFVRHAIVAVDVSTVVEFRDEKRGARVRRRVKGSITFRNSLMRLRGMTK